eukprot:CAMPEP_0204652134 /NCGR_PEP_ID=MMETSP0718-20130828/14375_1 /ASSEMBLY_ACC=CAM_ASM_000674 /TAXON_ID=230516 /ORGANISM="Chaetoceros curvisetus" /LENGTH=162 /DNA_ID=CAMNT_0051676053 /DNA_START=215 /DNA_END=706 /DNA_ORIENTATION=-
MHMPECVTSYNNTLSKLFNVDGVWDGKNTEVCTVRECEITNLFDTRGEEHGIERITCMESTTFNGFDILIHNDSSHLSAIIKCIGLDDFDGGEEHGIQGMTSTSHLSAIIKCIGLDDFDGGEEHGIQGMTSTESTSFNDFDILMHHDSFQLPAIFKCMLLNG